MITINIDFKKTIGKIVMLILIVILICLLVKNGKLDMYQTNAVWFLYIMILCLGYIFISLVLSFFGIMKVEADQTTGLVTFTRIFSKHIISKEEIRGYYISLIHTKRGISYGRIVELKNNKIEELNPSNLEEIENIDIYLKSVDVECLGKKKTMYPFTRGL